MPGKRKTNKKAKRKTYKNMQGAGFFGDIWKGIKTGANYANKYAKKYKLASAGLSLASIFQPELAPVAATVGALGYGKRRRKRY